MHSNGVDSNLLLRVDTEVVMYRPVSVRLIIYARWHCFADVFYRNLHMLASLLVSVCDVYWSSRSKRCEFINLSKRSTSNVSVNLAQPNRAEWSIGYRLCLDPVKTNLLLRCLVRNFAFTVACLWDLWRKFVENFDANVCDESRMRVRYVDLDDLSLDLSGHFFRIGPQCCIC